MPTSFKHQLETLIERFGFHYTRNQIKLILGAVPRAKVDLIEYVLSIVDGNDKLKGKLDELGLLALQLNTRQIEVFDVDEDNEGPLDKLFQLEVNINELISNAFPFPIENINSLKSLKKGEVYPIFSGSIELGDGEYKVLLISNVIEKDIELPVTESYLTSEALALKNEDAQFVIKKKIRTQLFHAIYWSAEKSQLILSVDRNGLSHLSSQDQLFRLRRFLMNNGIDCGMAINVFKAIEPMYNAHDGFVTKLGHVTTDGNPVRIPLKGRQKCLKQDHYHITGEDNGYVHAKFSVAKKWEFIEDDSERTVSVEVALVGKPQMLDTAQPLTDFSVNNARRLQDLKFAVNNVLSHIQSA